MSCFSILLRSSSPGKSRVCRQSQRNNVPAQSLKHCQARPWLESARSVLGSVSKRSSSAQPHAHRQPSAACRSAALRALLQVVVTTNDGDDDEGSTSGINNTRVHGYLVRAILAS